MASKRKISHVFYNNRQGSRLRGQPKTDGGIVYKQIGINAKLQSGKSGKNRGDWERSIKGRRSALDCSAT